MRYLQSRSEQLRVAQACHIGAILVSQKLSQESKRVRSMWKGILEGCEEHGAFCVCVNY